MSEEVRDTEKQSAVSTVGVKIVDLSVDLRGDKERKLGFGDGRGNWLSGFSVE